VENSRKRGYNALVRLARMPVTNPNNSVKGKKEGNENTKRGVKIPRQVVFFLFELENKEK
jgi:hypothetical protein